VDFIAITSAETRQCRGFVSVRAFSERTKFPNSSAIVMVQTKSEIRVLLGRANV
jgi:hypothetical protein